MLFANEIKTHLFTLALIILCMEVFLLSKEAPPDFSRGIFALAAISFFLMFSVLEYVFRQFVSGRASAFVFLLPAAFLFFLLKANEAPPSAGAALLTAAAARLLLVLIPRRDIILLYGSFVLHAAALYLRFGKNLLTGDYSTDRVLFICLVILTLAALQKLLWERNGEAFPFYYFALAGIILTTIPMSQEPINWKPVIDAGRGLIGKVTAAADYVSYYLPVFSDRDSYNAGYSSLNVTGGKVSGPEKTQLILTTKEKPYHLFRDEITSSGTKVRRTLYLAGGKGADRQQLVSFLRFLYGNRVDRKYAALFSQISEVTVEYAYLDTFDEIAPAGSILLSSGDRKIEGGVGDSRHKKGYRINARYLDIDYGSPYLISLFQNKSEEDAAEAFTYEDACSYMKALYGTDLGEILSREEYGEIAGGHDGPLGSGAQAAGNPDTGWPYLDTQGAGSRMKELADDLTAGALSSYDKCRLIEAYLRQYTYNTDAVGGHDPQSDMSTPSGMSDIADRFLFETKSGYCVHFTSSMVMLLRLAGIPARAVSGYRYVFPFEQQDTYEVGSRCAHIWPEAYLDSAGWVPFEPTAAYRTAADFTWGRKTDAAFAGKNDDPKGTTPYLNVPEITAETGNAGETGTAEDPGGQADPKEETARTVADLVLRIALPVLFSIALILAILILGTSFISRLRYRYGSPETRLVMDVEIIKKIIRRQWKKDFIDRGLLSDYVGRVPEELRPDLQKVFRSYYRMVYGDGNAAGISAEESAFARSVREHLQETKSRF